MNREAFGFTIVETMIFLAVTSVLFVSAITLVGGQQRKNQFTQTIRDFESKLRDVMNDVVTGYYPPSNYSCSYGPIFTAAVREQGSSKDCVFAGKVFHFGGSNKSDYHVYTLAGNRTTTISGTTEATSLRDTKPTVVQNQTLNLDLTENFTMPYNVEFLSAYSGTTIVSGIGFFNSFNGFIDNSSGSSELDVRVIASSLATFNSTTTSAMISTLNGIGSGVADDSVAKFPDSSGVTICLGNSGNKPYGQLVIGGQQKNQVVLNIVDNYDAATGVCS